jgi:hypothetical protein
MITSPEWDITRNIHREIDEESSIDALRDNVWEIRREPERFSLKSVSQSAEDDDIKDIRHSKSSNTRERESECLAENYIKSRFLVSEDHTRGEHRREPREKRETYNSEERYTINASSSFVSPDLSHNIVDTVDKWYEKYRHRDLELGYIYRSEMKRNISNRGSLHAECFGHENTEYIERYQNNELGFLRIRFVWFSEKWEHG